MAREVISGIENGCVLVPPQEKVGNPEGKAIEDDDIAAAGQSLARFRDVVWLLHRCPALGPLGLVTRDPCLHIRVKALGSGEKAAPGAPGQQGGHAQGFATLAATDAAQDEI